MKHQGDINWPISIWKEELWPIALKNISQKPKELFIRGRPPDRDTIFLTIVGSRRFSEYAEQVLNYFLEGLRNYPICIVSGLAFGVDSLAHKIAMQNNLKTIAFPGSHLSDELLYPQKNLDLAYEILENDGALISEFKSHQKTMSYFFPQRNRLMAGISKAVLIIEAGEKSGTMITARLALDYGKDVLCVPNNIFSEYSRGCLNLIKEGASPVTSPKDILEILGFNLDTENPEQKNLSFLNSTEKEIYLKIINGENLDQIQKELKIEQSDLNQILSTLEINGLI